MDSIEKHQPQQVQIGSGMWKVLFFLTGFVDGVQILIAVYVPVIGWIVNLIFNIFFGVPLLIYLKIKGVKTFTGRALVRLIVNFALDEATVGLFPGWTVALFFIYRSVKAKENPDKISSKVMRAIEKGVGILEPGKGKAPLNQNGMRMPQGRIAPLNRDGMRRPLNTPVKDNTIRKDFSPRTNQQDIEV